MRRRLSILRRAGGAGRFQGQAFGARPAQQAERRVEPLETREALDRLRIRLAGDRPQSESRAPAGPPQTPSIARRRLEALAEMLPMRIVDRPEGWFTIREQRYDAGKLTSGWGLGTPEFEGLEMWSGIRDESPFDYVFLDLETTGLDRGAGTYAFLAGLGRFNDGGFTVRQYFLAGPSGEQGHCRRHARRHCEPWACGGDCTARRPSRRNSRL